ncbi:hypothetical protein C7M84_001828 [Penaeus vannamei]|uniref:Reverse transcriptase domain-containing protein n=1 Tax=Penaeus vannamei TaxID=6689 RepID=A0A3R7MD64_PENVA|nr:hypothetical protein C7M84_001828 [Penaeus vannamei]
MCRLTGDAYWAIFSDFPAVFKPELRGTNPGAAAIHGVYHHIKTTGPPVHSRFRRLRPEMFHAAKLTFTEMVVCSKAASPWPSPLHMVWKPNNSWRPCSDYQRLNLITELDHYPMPNINDLRASKDNALIFSKLDLLKGDFQVPVHPDDVPMTAIITSFGSYVLHYSTFRLRNSSATFQRMMDQIFGKLPFCVVYVDDILIFSRNHQEHQQHVQTILHLLKQNGLVVSPDKCIFGASSIDFLGYKIHRPIKLTLCSSSLRQHLSRESSSS